MGDVIIAAAALRELPVAPALACHSMWHPLLRRAFSESRNLKLIPVDLPYTTRDRVDPFDTGGSVNESYPQISEVLSIRGDYRDFAAAQRIFPRASLRMNGWVRFLARRIAIVNLPYSLGLLPVSNRYRSWARLAGVDFGKIVMTYRQRQANAPFSRSVAIHVGAQWRSKQFPHVIELRTALTGQGWHTKILAGPSDRLPDGLPEEDVLRVVDEQLVEALSSAEQVITNDSGPMHVAAFLGCRTIAVVRTSPIEEWAPPAVTILRSLQTPRGYRPHRHYMSDEILSGWPSPSEILKRLRAT